ncbi:hypothetical protein BC827DRAFT_1192872 [Russula dissimulans]|nr:hypothetical protein BC827DRAFT_1192872 [Russula dissimulans]
MACSGTICLGKIFYPSETKRRASFSGKPIFGYLGPDHSCGPQNTVYTRGALGLVSILVPYKRPRIPLCGRDHRNWKLGSVPAYTMQVHDAWGSAQSFLGVILRFKGGCNQLHGTGCSFFFMAVNCEGPELAGTDILYSVLTPSAQSPNRHHCTHGSHVIRRHSAV